MYNDAHLHIGSTETIKNILTLSQYLKKYRAYSAVDLKSLDEQKEYLSTINDFLAIPIVFKEVDIQRENAYTANYCRNLGRGIPVTVIDNNEKFDENIPIALIKEHFLLHTSDDYQNRSLFYEYLNDNEGFLILHCKDKVRVDYLKTLRQNFPKMNIIVAHLGRNGVENQQEILSFLSQHKYDEKIYYDISTVSNVETIIRALSIVDSNKVLYGSDYPYEFRLEKELEFRKSLEKSLKNDQPLFMKLSGDNFERIKTRLRKK